MDPFISVHIRQAGDFTKALGERLGCTSSLALQLTSAAKAGIEASTGEYETVKGYGSVGFVDVTGPSGNLPELRIDGPFGAPAEDVFNCEIAVLIGTGIGVTPWGSVLKDIL